MKPRRAVCACGASGPVPKTGSVICGWCGERVQPAPDFVALSALIRKPGKYDGLVIYRATRRGQVSRYRREGRSWKRF